MIALGCLLLIVLPLAGLALGTFVGGASGALWFALGGLAIALVVCGVSVYALMKASRR